MTLLTSIILQLASHDQELLRGDAQIHTKQFYVDAKAYTDGAINHLFHSAHLRSPAKYQPKPSSHPRQLTLSFRSTVLDQGGEGEEGMGGGDGGIWSRGLSQCRCTRKQV